MLLGTILFFSSIIYFNQSGTKIEYRNLNYILKMVLTYGIALSSLYFGLYFYHGKKIAMQIGGGLALLLIISFILGFLLH